MEPDNTSSFTLTLENSDSPVKDDVSTFVLPSIIIPSTGIFSPLLTIMISSILTSSTATSFTSSSIKTLA